MSLTSAITIVSTKNMSSLIRVTGLYKDIKKVQINYENPAANRILVWGFNGHKSIDRESIIDLLKQYGILYHLIETGHGVFIISHEETQSKEGKHRLVNNINETQYCEYKIYACTSNNFLTNYNY